MKTIALVGVDGTGKSTLANRLENGFKKQTEILPEITRGDVFSFCNLPILDFYKASQKQLLEFDMSSLDLQISREEKLIKASDKEILVIDKAAPYYLMQLIFMSGRNMENRLVRDSVKAVNDHVKKYYNQLIYFPINAFYEPKQNSDRTGTSSYIVSTKDNALEYVIRWLDIKYFKLSGKLSARVDVIASLIDEEVGVPVNA